VDRVSGWRPASSGPIGLADVIANIEVSVLIGLSTVPGSFTEPIIREMARKTSRPIILPLSNPTEKSGLGRRS
jgi:malate dehydrogenase (oxaloacetate-decarboxylating)